MLLESLLEWPLEGAPDYVRDLAHFFLKKKQGMTKGLNDNEEIRCMTAQGPGCVKTFAVLPT
jgi:hypothetical protein